MIKAHHRDEILYDTFETAINAEKNLGAAESDSIKTHFMFDQYTCNIVVSSYNHLHAQLAQQ